MKHLSDFKFSYSILSKETFYGCPVGILILWDTIQHTTANLVCYDHNMGRRLHLQMWFETSGL